MLATTTVESCEFDAIDQVGNDPDCGFAKAEPTWHHCTDRDGAPVVGDKACFAWARHTLVNPPPALSVVEATGPACPACGRAIHQNAEAALVRSGRYVANPTYVVVDQTWRHDDGTVAVMPGGATSCEAVAA